MTELAESLRSSLSGGSLVALPLVLIGGLITGVNPCCLALYPAAAATCCATRADRASLAFRTAASFVLGLAIATATLGVLAALAGRVMTGLGGWFRYGIALVPLAMGVHVLGWIRLPMPVAPPAGSRGLGGAFLTGLVLSLAIAPCGTPVLASVLSYAAFEGNVAYGGVLLLLFGIGAGLPVLLVGGAAGRLGTWLDTRGWRRRVDQANGSILLGLGFYLLWTA